jgi:hypothetical protein
MSKIALNALCKIAPLVILFTACSFADLGDSSTKKTTTDNSTAENLTTEGWTTHEDPAGFAVEIPAGWQVNSKDGRITVAGPNSERVTIYPLKVEGQLDGESARGVLLGVANQFWPGRKWDMPKGGWQFGQNGVRAVGADEGGLRETAALWWANTPQGATCFFYEVAAEGARFQPNEQVFARVLKSFRVTQAGTQAQSSDPLAGTQFQRWTDPTESAFSLEVPADWRVSGGIKRGGMSGHTSEWVAQSPDGQLTIRGGDNNIPHSYIELNQTMADLGYSEGQMYTGGMMISRFMPAVQFATNYVQMTTGRNCSNLQWLAQRDRPDFVQQLGQQGMLIQGNQYTAGEVTFTCQAGGQPFVGYLFVETTAAPDMGVAVMWNLKTLYGFMAPADRARQADTLLQRMLASINVNPQWVAAQRGMEARMAEDNRRYFEFSSNLQKQTQDERWASWDRISEQRGDVLRGHTRVVAPESGQAYKVESGSSYYWLDPTREVIVGTNTPYSPSWDFTEMVQTYR